MQPHLLYSYLLYVSADVFFSVFNFFKNKFYSDWFKIATMKLIVFFFPVSKMEKNKLSSRYYYF